LRDSLSFLCQDGGPPRACNRHSLQDSRSSILKPMSGLAQTTGEEQNALKKPSNTLLKNNFTPHGD